MRRVRNLQELIATLDGNCPAGKAPFERLETFLEDITLDQRPRRGGGKQATP